MTESFTEINNEYNLKNEATSNTKRQEVLNNWWLKSNFYMGDSKFSEKCGIVNFHPFKGTHCTTHRNQKSFHSHGFSLPNLVRAYINKRKRKFDLAE